MKKVFYVLPTCLLLLGCASLTQKQAEQARESRQQAAETIQKFAGALADDNVSEATGQLSPFLSAEKREELLMAVRRATWLSFYTGYQLDATKAVQNRDLNTWLRDAVELSVPASNARGAQFSQWMQLRSTPQGWKLADVALKSARRGADVDLPTQDREKVKRRMSKLLEKLKDGKYEEVSITLPEATQVRRIHISWWEKLWGGSAPRQHVYNDLRRLEKLTIHRWPEPEKHLPTAYVSTNSVMVIYTLPYSYPARGIHDDELRIETLMSRKDNKWKPVSLRLYGEAIPQ